jgi:signal transduction histidine kinase
MHADLLREESNSSSELGLVEEIIQAAERCKRLVRSFLTLARQHKPERTAVALNTLITETLELLAYLLRVDDITIHLALAEDLPLFRADPYQLQQVVTNLLTNAHHALRESSAPRQLTLTTRCNPARTFITFEVADNGPGIPPEIQARIFEPFFTTKPLGVGTGLGLPLCRGIVEGHGGTLSVASQPSQGTTFYVELPIEEMAEILSVPPELGSSPP